MDYEEIIEAIRQAGGGLSRDTAERAAQATLQTLAERLPRGEARRILQELPAELKPFIYTETDAEALDIDEFLSRVADREGTDTETALRHARAVFAALGRTLSPEAVEHLAAALPQIYEPLVVEAQFRYLEIMPTDKFPSGSWMNRSITLRTGQCHVQRYMKPLLQHIEKGDLDPARIITHTLPLEQAPHGYDIFKHKQDNCEKVVLKPSANGGGA